MNWTDLDAAYNVAKTNHFPFKMHTLIWGNQQPAWIESLPPAEQLEEIEEWFSAVAARYPDIEFIDVVNEPLHDPPSQTGNGNYIDALGGAGASGWEWVLTAFRMARAHFPNAKLLINEYSVTNNSADMQRYIEIIRLLQAEGLIDAVGVQGHAFSTRPNVPMETQAANLNALAATGLPIYISELDIDGPTDEVQLADYQRIFPLFWEHPSVKGITLWGFRPGHWRTAQGAYLVLDNGAERPAMVWLQNYVKDNPPLVKARQVFNIDATGKVVATDVDSATTLSGWRIAAGNDAGIFAIDSATGALSVTNPLSVDFRRKDYSPTVMVSDGLRASTAVPVTVRIPELVKLCHRGHNIVVPRLLAHEFLKHGDGLGRCAN
jgi:endo-1,4-beta-xylanase